MNRTSIEWTDYTWNPVTGCKHGCSYCYARRVAKRFKKSFEPEYHLKRLFEPKRRHKPAKIFVCSMADLFGDFIPTVWIKQILDIVWECPQHTFQFLTKNPERLVEFNPWPDNCWVGATTATREGYDRAVEALPAVDAQVRYISAEPLLFKPDCIHYGLDWIIIGAQTGPGAKPLNSDWVERLTYMAHAVFIPVFHKDNLGIMAEYKEFPKESG